MEYPVEGAVEELLLSIPAEEHPIFQRFTGQIRYHEAAIRRGPKPFASELHEDGAHEPHGRGVMREIAEVMLEATAKDIGELIPHKWEVVFEEADSVCDARVLFLESNALSRSDNDFLDFFGP